MYSVPYTRCKLQKISLDFEPTLDNHLKAAETSVI